MEQMQTDLPMTNANTMDSITSVQTLLFKVPLREVLSDAMHGDHTHFELVTVTIELAIGDGRKSAYTARVPPRFAGVACESGFRATRCRHYRGTFLPY